MESKTSRQREQTVEIAGGTGPQPAAYQGIERAATEVVGAEPVMSAL